MLTISLRSMFAYIVLTPHYVLRLILAALLLIARSLRSLYYIVPLRYTMIVPLRYTMIVPLRYTMIVPLRYTINVFARSHYRCAQVFARYPCSLAHYSLRSLFPARNSLCSCLVN
jgi:hypothetical protein